MAIRSPITTMPVFGGSTDSSTPAPSSTIPPPSFDPTYGQIGGTSTQQSAPTFGGMTTQPIGGTTTSFNSPLGGTSTQQTAGRVTPTVNPATFSTAQGNVYAPPSVPTFAPSTYVNTPVTGMTGTFSQPTLDSYLRSSVQSLFSPSSIENGTAMRDPTQMLTSLANNYLALNPGAGSQADIQNLVNQYTKQYTDWYGQYDQYLKNENGKIALPSGSPYAQAAGQQLNQPVSTPQTNTTGMTNNTQTTSQTTNWQSILQQYLGSLGSPQYQTVKTPLGYTQYQSNVPQTSQNGIDPMTQLLLSYLMGSNGSGGSQGSFWNLLAGGH